MENESIPKEYTKQASPRIDYWHDVPNNRNGSIIRKTRVGSYNTIERDYGDRKVIYHIPIEYGDDYDISVLENMPTMEEQMQQQQREQEAEKPLKLVRSRTYQNYNDFNNDNDFDEYVEEVSPPDSQNANYSAPRRQELTQVDNQYYRGKAITDTVEYIYEDDYPQNPDYRPVSQQEIVYLVPEPSTKQNKMAETRPSTRVLYAEEPSVPLSSTTSTRPIVCESPHHNSVRSLSSLQPDNPIDVSLLSSGSKQKPFQSSTIHAPLNYSNAPTSIESMPQLADVIAQNRARRGTRIPIPKREVEEIKMYDPPIYNRDTIKGGSIVYK